MSIYTDYADHMKGLDRKQFLGFLTWYTVPEDLQVPHADIASALLKVDLAGHTPKVPSDADVFRRKCSAAARKKVASGTGTFYNYLVRDPGSNDPTKISRQIVREEVDAANRRLSYEAVAEVTFDRETSSVTYDTMCDMDTATSFSNVCDICQGILDAYENERGCLNGYAVRELIRKVLTENNATNVRYPAGGVYFLSIDHAAAVAGIEDVAASLSGVNVHSLPLLDDGKQREMLKRAFEAESIDRANALVTEIAQLRSEGKKIGADRYATYVAALNDLRGKMGEYTEVCKTAMTSTNSALAILQRQVVGLMGNVDTGRATS